MAYIYVLWHHGIIPCGTWRARETLARNAYKKILEKCVILLLLSKTRAQHAPQRSQLCYTQPKVPIILCDMMLLVSSYGHRQERPHSYIVEMLVNIFICVDRPRISR